MVSLARIVVACLLLALALTSCSKNQSLQTYFVDHQEQPGFLSMDVPKSILNIDESALSPEEKEAFKSIDRLNMLAYRIDEQNSDAFNIELNKVKTILDAEQYEELLRGGNLEDGKFVIKYLGDNSAIKEFVMLGHANDKGFAVVRVLGKNMSADKIMNLSQVMSKSNMEEDAFKDLVKFFY